MKGWFYEVSFALQEALCTLERGIASRDLGFNEWARVWHRNCDSLRVGLPVRGQGKRLAQDWFCDGGGMDLGNA